MVLVPLINLSGFLLWYQFFCISPNFWQSFIPSFPLSVIQSFVLHSGVLCCRASSSSRSDKCFLKKDSCSCNVSKERGTHFVESAVSNFSFWSQLQSHQEAEGKTMTESMNKNLWIYVYASDSLKRWIILHSFLKIIHKIKSI